MKTIFFIFILLFINLNCNAQFVDDKLNILARSFNKRWHNPNMISEPLFKFEQYILDSVCKNKQDSILFIKNRISNITIWITFKPSDLKASKLVNFFIDYQRRFPDIYLNIYYIDSSIKNNEDFIDTIYNKYGTYCYKPNVYFGLVDNSDVDKFYFYITYQTDLNVGNRRWSIHGGNYHGSNFDYSYEIDDMLNYINFIRFYKQFVYLPYVKHNLDNYSKDLIYSLEDKGLDISIDEKEKILNLAKKEMEH